MAVRYPLITSRGAAFPLEVTVYNSATAPFLGELLLNAQQDDFACVAAARRTLQIGPEGQSTTRYSLFPLRVGELVVPAVQVRSAATSHAVAHSGEGYIIHVLPEGQVTLAENST